METTLRYRDETITLFSETDPLHGTFYSWRAGGHTAPATYRHSCVAHDNARAYVEKKQAQKAQRIVELETFARENGLTLPLPANMIVFFEEHQRIVDLENSAVYNSIVVVPEPRPLRTCSVTTITTLGRTKVATPSTTRHFPWGAHTIPRARSTMTNLTDYRFAKQDLTLKPGKVSGQSVLCLVYADSRAYQVALDSTGVTWATSITVVNDKTAIVALTVDGVTRSASGEDTDFMSAEARAFKRACSAFGLGRYLYAIDLGFQPYDGELTCLCAHLS